MNAAVRINPITEISTMLADRQPEFEAALPPHIPVERFMRVVLTAIQNNPALAKVERRSLFLAAIKAAQDGLLPDGRESALVIYRDKSRGEIAQYMPMIAGLRKKVRNSGEIATWDAQVVYERDAFEYELGDEPFIRHKPAMGDRGSVIGAYSVAVLKSGEKSREVMSVSEIESVRKRSRASGNGPWVTDYAEMCRKTVARRHSKVLPMSTDLDDLIRRDDELYDLQSSSDKAISDERPKGLAARMDALAAPRANSVPDHDPETGEYAEDENSADGDDADAAENDGDDPPPGSTAEASPPKSAAASPSPAGASKSPPSKPTNGAPAGPSSDDHTAPPWGTEESINMAYLAGTEARRKGLSRRALPAEYREEKARAEADAWENGHHDEDSRLKAEGVK